MEGKCLMQGAVPRFRLAGRDVEPWGLAIAALFVAGLLIRAALYLPLAAFPGDSDGVQPGLCAFHVGDGHFPLFTPEGTRHGSVTCYLTAAFMALVGPTRLGLALNGFTLEALFLLCMLLFLREVLSPARACLAFLFVAAPPVQFLTVTYIPFYYGEVMVACAAALFFAARWRKRATFWTVFLFGLISGIALWLSFISAMVIAPAGLWIAWRRSAAVVREAWPALCGSVIGFSPWLVYNAMHGFASLTSNFATKPISRIGQAASNFIYQLSYNLPMLLTDGSSHDWGTVSTIFLCAYLVIGVGVLLALRAGGTSEPAKSESAASLLGLGVMVLALTILLNVISEPGSIRGWTVRYVAPFYLVVPPFMAIGLAKLWQTRPWLAVVPLLSILGLNLMLYSLPGTATREALTAELEQHKRLQTVLAEANVQALLGNYWLVYHLNFDSRRHILGVPLPPDTDYYNYAGSLPVRGLRWALIARDANELERRTSKIGARGRIVAVDGLQLFLPDPASDTAGTSKLIEALSQPL